MHSTDSPTAKPRPDRRRWDRDPCEENDFISAVGRRRLRGSETFEGKVAGIDEEFVGDWEETDSD